LNQKRIKRGISGKFRFDNMGLTNLIP
jgi:hypothetical protein